MLTSFQSKILTTWILIGKIMFSDYVIDHFVLLALYIFKPVLKSHLLNTNRTRPAGLPAPR